MISPYKKPLLRIDLAIQITFLVILFGSYGMTFLASQIDSLEAFTFSFLFPILALGILALLNPVMNILHLILGDYSDEAHKLRKNYTFAILGYVIIGIIGFFLLQIPTFSFINNLGIIYLYGISHLFAIGYVYITILENKTQKIVERRLYY
jgi:predicted Co/Zn/Cd cation transporter (cation efflux family)